MVIRKTPVECSVQESLEILDSRLRGNDMFFQSVTSLSVIPAKAGIQALIDNWSIPNKLKFLIFFVNTYPFQELTFPFFIDIIYQLRIPI